MVEKFIDLTAKYDSKISLNEYIEFNAKLKKALRNVAWDGEYYLRAFFDNGKAVGSSKNK